MSNLATTVLNDLQTAQALLQVSSTLNGHAIACGDLFGGKVSPEPAFGGCLVLWVAVFSSQMGPYSLVMRPNSVQKAFNLCPVTPTCWNEMPFGDNVEGLSHCGAEGSAAGPFVQTDDSADPPLRGVARSRPLLQQGLRAFKQVEAHRSR